MTKSGRVYVVGTCDTKQRELSYVRDLVAAAGVPAVLVDVSTASENDVAADIRAVEISGYHPEGPQTVFVGDRGRAIGAMAVAFERFMVSRDDVAGIVGLGGSGGTALVTPAMRALPVGTAKVMVSTVAAGNVGPYVGPSDICMMPSVTDIAGLNRISRVILANAAHAVAGMASGQVPVGQAEQKPAIGLSMFGVTTPCITQLTQRLDDDYDCLVFHATGTGGQSMEKLLDSGLVTGLIDVTTTEVCDLMLGGVFPATEDRFGAVARTAAPYVGSCGALDMVNFGAPESVPAHYRERNLYAHNPQVTLMRTTAEENARMGRWIGEKLNRCDGDVRFLLPEKGVSQLDAPGQPFYDPEADEVLFAALEESFKQTSRRRLVRLPCNVNDREFVDALVAHFREIATEA